MLAICLMAWAATNAQEYFEGTLKARTFEKHSKNAIKLSQGTLINGARDVELHIKGNCVAVVDHATNIQTIYDLNKKKIYYLFHHTKKAIDMPSSSLEQMMKGALEPQATDEYRQILGMKCRLYSAKKNTKEKGAHINQNIQIYICEELPVHPDLAPFVSQNTGLPYLGVKYVVDTNTAVPPLFKMNSYVAYEINDVQRGAVDESLFTIPADYEVVDGSQNAKMLSVYKENYKILQKKNKGKEEPAEEIKFDVNEDWDF